MLFNFKKASTIILAMAFVLVVKADDEHRNLRWWHGGRGRGGNGRGNRPGNGGGMGGGGGNRPGYGGGMGGWNDAEPSRMEVIHNLIDDRSKINRDVNLTATGAKTYTWSESDPQVSEWIQIHVAQMIRLLNTGGSIRRWDPLFREIFENYEDFSITVTNSTNGVYVTSVGNTECAVNLAQFHAEAVSGFIEHGRARVQRAHSVPEEC